MPLRWGPDGSLYYSRMPIGIGGLNPYLAFADLWRYELTSGESTQIVPSPGPGRVCLEDLSSDACLLASTCQIGEIQLLDLSNDETTTISLAEGIRDALAGSVRFSPDAGHLVYGIFLGTAEEQSSAVAISDGISGGSKVVAESEEPGFYAPLAWLDEEIVLVQFNPQEESEPASLWSLKANGSEFTQIVEGNFLEVLEQWLPSKNPLPEKTGSSAASCRSNSSRKISSAATCSASPKPSSTRAGAPTRTMTMTRWSVSPCTRMTRSRKRGGSAP